MTQRLILIWFPLSRSKCLININSWCGCYCYYTKLPPNRYLSCISLEALGEYWEREGILFLNFLEVVCGSQLMKFALTLPWCNICLSQRWQRGDICSYLLAISIFPIPLVFMISQTWISCSEMFPSFQSPQPLLLSFPCSLFSLDKLFIR